MNHRPEPPPDADPTAAPGWMVTYGDMMSLLLTFFVLLVSLSELKSESRVVQAVDAMQKQFGRERVENPDENAPTGGSGSSKSAQRLRSPNGEKPNAVGGAIVFAEDSIELADAERARLVAILADFQGKLQRIEIRGHTSRRPMPDGSPYADHWDLAYARCREVLRVAVAEGIDPKRLRLSVAGGNEPLYTGDDPRERRENSRVELFLLNEFAGNTEKTSEGTAAAQTAR